MPARAASPGSSTSRPARREWDDVIAAAERNADVWATVGVHPHEADAHPDLGAAALVDAASHPRVIAIGECGLDYYLRQVRPRGAARALPGAYRGGARDRPALVVHTRDAEDDTAEMLGRAVEEGRRHRRAPLLHRQRRACAQGAGPRLLHLALAASSPSRMPRTCRKPPRSIPRGPAAGGDGFALPRARPAPRPDLRAGIRRRHRRASLPSCAVCRSRRSLERTTANFFRLFNKAAA